MKSRRRPETIATSSATFEGVDAPVEVRRHPSARRMTLRVSRTKRAVIVTVPMSCGLEQAGTFLNRHLDWVRERLGSMPKPVPFGDGTVIPVRGTLHTIGFTDDRAAGPLITLEPGREGPRLLVHGRRASGPRHLRAWLFQEARADIEHRVGIHCATLDLACTKITIRDQASRWGSCSHSGALSFSWRLILAPPLVLDYVAAHEVAHLAEMNHGPRFWSLVRQAMPQMDEAKLWLHHYGSELHRYGADA